MAALDPTFFNGLICISPAFKSKLQFPFLEQIKIYFSFFCNPKKHFQIPANPQMCTQDQDYQKIMDSDPYECHTASAKLLVNALIVQMRVKFLRNKIKIPTLFLLSGIDELVSSHASTKFFSALKLKDKQIVEYPDMRHALSIELDRERVFMDILKWIQERI